METLQWKVQETPLSILPLSQGLSQLPVFVVLMWTVEIWAWVLDLTRRGLEVRFFPFLVSPRRHHRSADGHGHFSSKFKNNCPNVEWRRGCGLKIKTKDESYIQRFQILAAPGFSFHVRFSTLLLNSNVFS